MKNILCIAVAATMAFGSAAADRWQIKPDSLVININADETQLPHADHVEMSGEKMAVVLYWSLDSDAVFGLNRALVFPMLRTIPNNTHASLMLHIDLDPVSMIRVNN